MLVVKKENLDCVLGIRNKTPISYKYYTKSSCEIECIKTAQLLYCGCVLHVLPPKKGIIVAIYVKKILECNGF